MGAAQTQAELEVGVGLHLGEVVGEVPLADLPQHGPKADLGLQDSGEGDGSEDAGDDLVAQSRRESAPTSTSANAWRD